MAHSQVSHAATYLAVFIALCILTALSVVFDLLELNNRVFLAFLVLAVATGKALFVMMFFMHLKFEGNWKFLLLAPTIILAMAIPFALAPDIGMHYYTVDVPQLEAEPHHGSQSAPEH